jgi:lambda family phage portal protein
MLEPIDLSAARHALMKQPRRSPRRAFNAADSSRLTSDWSTLSVSPDQALWTDLRRMRMRSRDLARNSWVAAKFLKMVGTNVVGPSGVTMQAKLKMQRGAGKLAKDLNEAIEQAWCQWGYKGICTLDGKLSFQEACRLFIRTVAKDGECLVRKVKTNANPFGFALQFIDADQLDHTFFGDRGGANGTGNEIRMGVEIDQYYRPVAYYLWNRNPYEWGQGAGRERKRIPASEIIHCYVGEDIAATRGFPWMAPTMFDVNMLKGYTEAEIVAARTAASKQGFFVSKLDPDSAFDGDGRNEDGTISMESQPGVFEQLPPGVDFKPWDPQHPATAFGDFIKHVLRGIAAGNGVSYNSLAEDLEGVNFSSIRAGLLNERDEWKMLQSFFIDSFLKPVFSAWLEMAMLAGVVDIGVNDLPAVMEQIEWHPRRWSWVDPYKDAQANILAVENGFTTRTKVLGEMGDDFEETIEQLAEEKKIIDAAGLKLGTDAKGVADTATDDQNAADSGGDSSPATKPKKAAAKA